MCFLNMNRMLVSPSIFFQQKNYFIFDRPRPLSKLSATKSHQRTPHIKIPWPWLQVLIVADPIPQWSQLHLGSMVILKNTIPLTYAVYLFSNTKGFPPVLQICVYLSWLESIELLLTLKFVNNINDGIEYTHMDNLTRWKNRIYMLALNNYYKM